MNTPLEEISVIFGLASWLTGISLVFFWFGFKKSLLLPQLLRKRLERFFWPKAPEIRCVGRSLTEVLEQKFYCHRIEYNKIQQIIERTDR